jgi:hypothetical protein
MLRRVALVRTDVSEELSASFIRVTRIGELGTTLAVTRNRCRLRRNTKSLLTRVTRRNIPEYTILHSHRRENLKSYMSRLSSCQCNCLSPLHFTIAQERSEQFHELNSIYLKMLPPVLTLFLGQTALLLHCNPKLHKPIHCNPKLHKPIHCSPKLHKPIHCNPKLHKPVHCNPKLHKPIHCSLKLHKPIHCSPKLHKPIHCNPKLHKPVHCNSKLHKPIHCSLKLHKPIHCNPKLHKPIHCSLKLHKPIHCNPNHKPIHCSLKLHKPIQNVPDG